LQRWVNRDPLAERGGLNLYLFVGNDPIRLVDLFGFAPRPPCASFWPAYPNYDDYAQPDVWKKIGGNVGAKYGPDSNSCAARLSCGLNDGGDPIPRGTPAASRNFPDKKYENKPGDNKYYIVSARAMKEHLTKSWGRPDRVAKTAEDLKDIVKNLKPGECAVFATTGHVGVLKDGYQDPHVGGMLPVDVWILPGTLKPAEPPQKDGKERPR
jgi:hypothetical protein